MPFVVEPTDRPEVTEERQPLRHRASSIDSSSDDSSDDESEPTVTICRRVGGVFHYIPAQRLLKNGLRGDVVDTDG